MIVPDEGTKLSEGQRIWVLYAASQVRRWHTKGYIIRQQDLSQHQYGVAVLITLLHPNPSTRLLKAGLHHDLPELVFGDPPRYAKIAEPELKVIIERGENKMALRFGLQTEDGLTADEVAWLHCCDLFDAWLFLMQNIICKNEMVREDFNRATRAMRQGWKEQRYPWAPVGAMEDILKQHPDVKVW